MSKKVLTVYYSISIVFLIILVTLIVYRLSTCINQNLTAIHSSFEKIKISALSTYLAEGEFDSEIFKQKIKRNFLNMDKILLLSIYSKEKGILYLLTSSKYYLLSPLIEDLDRPGVGEAWKGKPEYKLNSIHQTKISSFFAPGIDRDLHIDGLFELIGKTDLYPILKEILCLLLIFFVLTIMTLLFATISKKPGPVKHFHPSYTPVHQKPVKSSQKADTAQPGRSLTSPETGLGWKEHLEQRLRFELERAASFDQDLSLVFITLDTGLSPAQKDTYNQMSRLVIASFPFKDLAFEYGTDAFAVILPDRSLEKAIADAKGFKRRVESSFWGGRRITVSIGLSARNGRLISEQRLLIETKKSLEQAIKAGGNQIIAFRADPEKFRRVLTSIKG